MTSRHDWQGFYHNVIQQVKDGIIPMERIDDAVTRILRVKMRAQLWEKPQPSFVPMQVTMRSLVLTNTEHLLVKR